MFLVYCPIPPCPSSSSDFLQNFLQESAPLLLGKDVKIVVDGGAFPGHCPSFYLGFPVIDCRFWSPPIDAHVTHLIFIATHKLHRYCYRALKMPKLGPTVAIVCDLDESEKSFTQAALRAQILGLSLADEVWVTHQVTADLMNAVPTHLIQNIGQSMESLLERVDRYIKNNEPDFRLTTG